MKNAELSYSLLKALGAKEKAENLLWRDTCWRAGYESKEVADALWIACSRDILFWINSFVWIQEVRGADGSDKCIPMITYDFQDETIDKIVSAVDGQFDFLTEKSRDMGASYMNLLVILHKWLFRYENSFMLTSRTEDLVDKTDDVDSLFGKLEYIIRRLPVWMRPPLNKQARTHMKLLNQHTGSIITGSATSKDAGVGGRKTAILMDEFALVDQGEKRGDAMLTATRNNTNCRMFNSTPRGIDTAYYRMRNTDIDKVSLHWTRHPLKNKGLYCVRQDGTIEILDAPWHKEHPGYEFVHEPGSMSAVCKELGVYGCRSPYYDKQCKRTHSKVEIAQEEDIDYHGAGAAYFDADIIARCRSDSRRPERVCSAKDFLGKEFRDRRVNPLKLWTRGVPTNTRYAMGVDISTGTGASDSAISVWDAWSREKVAEYVSNQILPEHLAELVVELKKKFSTDHGECFLNFDQGGEGHAFSVRLSLADGLQPCYYYRSKVDRRKNRKGTPGYPAGGAGNKLKRELFAHYREQLSTGGVRNCSRAAIDSAEEYVHGANGPEHAKENSTDDRSGNKQNHGDLAYADALAVLALDELPPKQARKAVVPIGSLAWHRQRWAEEDKRKDLNMFVA